VAVISESRAPIQGAAFYYSDVPLFVAGIADNWNANAFRLDKRLIQKDFLRHSRRASIVGGYNKEIELFLFQDAVR